MKIINISLLFTSLQISNIYGTIGTKKHVFSYNVLFFFFLFFVHLISDLREDKQSLITKFRCSFLELATFSDAGLPFCSFSFLSTTNSYLDLALSPYLSLSLIHI